MNGKSSHALTINTTLYSPKNDIPDSSEIDISANLKVQKIVNETHTFKG
jgi:hypothetical protein